MRISDVRIDNFRGIRELLLTLEDTTVLIGANNSGKTAVLEAIRIALSRRWGRRGTGFTEYDIHSHGQPVDPRVAPPVTIALRFLEEVEGTWDADMSAALEDVVVVDDLGRNLVSLRVTCQWNADEDAFTPVWEFLNAAGSPLTGKARRATNFSEFFRYAPLYHLSAIRDVEDQFATRSSLWSGLLRSMRIPRDVEDLVQGALSNLDDQLLAADPRLGQISQTIAQAAKVTVGQGSGDARLRMLPFNTWDLLSRASVVLRNDELRPWLPLSHHGQGLQSLAVIFLFQAAVQQAVAEELPGVEPIFLLEEPEVHLHPQAARALWDHINGLPGQKIATTHSPFFVHHVPLHNLRLAKLADGQASFTYLPRFVETDLQWNSSLQQLASNQGTMFSRDKLTDKLTVSSWFDPQLAQALCGCFRHEPDGALIDSKVDLLRHRSRGLISATEEHELSFLGRRIRGEIFFARRWLLVEGQTEYVLVHAIARALGHPLDRHGVAVIDYKNCGDAPVYAALATSFEIPWAIVTDGGTEGSSCHGRLLKRGFTHKDLEGRFTSLERSSLEAQLIADGHEPLLRTILARLVGDSALTCTGAILLKRLQKGKVACIGQLALQVEASRELAERMPGPLVDAVKTAIAGVT